MTATLTEAQPQAVPQPILDRLRRVIRRARLVILIRGILIVLAVALGALLVGMALDASVTIFSPAGRLALSLSLLSVVVLASYWFLARPLLSSYSLIGMARLVETRHPEMEERISSAIQLLTSPEDPSLLGSSEMIQQLTFEATDQVVDVNPEREFSFRALKHASVALLVLAGIFGLLMLLRPGPTSRLVVRLVAPLADVENIHAANLSVVPGDTLVAFGTPLDVEVSAWDRRTTKADLQILDADGNDVTMAMSEVESKKAGGSRRKFHLQVPQIEKDFQYRVHAAGGLSRYYQVTVVPLPDVERMRAELTYPAYLNRTHPNEADDPQEIVAPIGSTVRVVGDFNKELASAHLILDEEPLEGTQVGTDDGKSSFAWEFTLTNQFASGLPWSFELMDRHGFRNKPEEYSVRALRDRAPRIEILAPSQDRLRLPRTESLPITYTAEDDYGIKTIELLVTINDGETQFRLLTDEIDPHEKRARHTVLDLAELGLVAGRTVKLQLRATDNLPIELGGVRYGLSRELFITIDGGAAPYLAQRAASEHSAMRKTLLATLAQLQEAKEHTKELGDAAAVEGPLPMDVRDDVDAARDLLRQAENQVRDVANSARNGTFATVAPQLDQLASDQIKPARTEAGQVKMSDDPGERSQHGKAADRQLAAAIAKTKSTIAELDNKWQQVQQVARMKHLATEQNNLADQIASLPANAKQADLLPLWGDQAQVAAKVAELANQSPKLRRALLDRQSRDASELGRRAAMLADAQQRLAGAPEDKDQAARRQAMRELALQILRNQRQIALDAAALEDKAEVTNPADRKQMPNLPDLDTKPKEAFNAARQGRLTEAAETARNAAKSFDKAADALEQRPRDDGPPQQTGAEPKQPAATQDSRGRGKQPGDPEQPTDLAKPTSTQPGAATPQNPPGQAKQDPNQDNPPRDGSAPREGTQQSSEPEHKGQNQPRDGAEPQKNGQPGANNRQPSPTAQQEELAQDARRLAERQQNVADQLDAVKAGDLERARSLLQEEVAEEAEQLAQAGRRLEQQLSATAPNNESRQAAESAASNLADAEKSARNAQQELGGSKDPSGTQRSPSDDPKNPDGARNPARPSDANNKDPGARSGDPAGSESGKPPQDSGSQPRGDAKPAQSAAGAALKDAAKDLASLSQQLSASSSPSSEHGSENGQPNTPQGRTPESENGSKQPGASGSENDSPTPKQDGNPDDPSQSGDSNNADSQASAQNDNAGSSPPSQSGSQQSGSQQSGSQQSGSQQSGSQQSGSQQSGSQQSGSQQSGSQQSGSQQSGSQQSGSQQSGSQQSGSQQSGSQQSGSQQSGSQGSGSQQSGSIGNENELIDAVQAAASAAADLAAASEASMTPSGSSNGQSATSAQPGAASSQGQGGNSSTASAAQAARAAAEALSSAAASAAQAAGVPSGQQGQSQGQSQTQGSSKGGGGQPASAAQASNSRQGSSQAGGQPNNGGNTSSGSGGSGSSGSPKESTAETGDLDQALAAEYGISNADWIRLPGRLKDQIRQSNAENVPEEYRDLVRRYFRALAERAAQPTSNPR